MPGRYSASAAGPSPTVLCVDVSDNNDAGLVVLSDRPGARARDFRFLRFLAPKNGDIQSDFWALLPEAAGIVVGLGHLAETVRDLAENIALSDERRGCPMLVRVQDPPGRMTFGDFLWFYWAVRRLEEADVDIWVDGDIDRMQVRRRNLPALAWRAEYPPTPETIERQLDSFLTRALHHHNQYWEPIVVHTKVTFANVLR